MFLQKRKQFVIRVATMLVTIAIGLCLYALNVSTHLFKRDSTVAVALNNVPLANARVYRSSQDIWLIDTGNGTEWYGYVGNDKYLMTCHPPQRIPLPRSLYLLKDDLPCIGFNDVKSFNPHLLITSQSIEFDSHEHSGRVKVTWP